MKNFPKKKSKKDPTLGCSTLYPLGMEWNTERMEREQELISYLGVALYVEMLSYLCEDVEVSSSSRSSSFRAIRDGKG